MNRRNLIINAMTLLASTKIIPLMASTKQSITLDSASKNKSATSFLDIAEQLKPVLTHTQVSLLRAVEFQEVSKERFIVDPDKCLSPQHVAQHELKQGEQIILDFGDHYTGYLSCDINWAGKSADAPARLRLTFGEVASDVCQPLYPYQGMISASWLPDEIMNIDDLPAQCRVRRRHAFRYVKVEVLALSTNFTIKLDNITVDAVSSAGKDLGRPLTYATPMLAKIDKVASKTLSECMQTTFEDGPRRDQRLWLGDLRLQSLTNSYSFKHNQLVKRCLYLFAAYQDTRGYMPACVYEKPSPRIGEAFLLDYCLLFCVTLADFYHATNDDSILEQLFPVAETQLRAAIKFVDHNGLFQLPTEIKCFIDWHKDLDKQAAMQGVMIYTLVNMIALAEVTHQPSKAKEWLELKDKMIIAARHHFWDEEHKVFISGPERQLSCASQAWLGLADIVSPELASAAIETSLNSLSAVKPNTPYLYHYIIEALIKNNNRTAALTLMTSYWGGMIDQGADTFWECYKPNDPYYSPYGGKQINSYCHAWSCTPTYFIRRYFS